MSRPHARERFLQALEQTTRALSGNSKLKISFGNAPTQTADMLQLPELPPRPTRRDLLLARGLADRAAFLRRFNPGAAFQAEVAHLSPVAQQALGLIEAARVEALGVRDFGGAKDNLRALGGLEAQAQKMRDAENPPLAYLMSLALRESLGFELDPVQTELLTTTRDRLNGPLARWLKDAPEKLADDQRRLSAYRDLLRLLGLQPPDTDDNPQEGENPPDVSPPQAQGSDGTSGSESDDATGAEGEAGLSSRDTAFDGDDTNGDDPSSGTEGARPPHRLAPGDSLGLYKPYTTQFDTTAPAGKLVSVGEMNRLRERYKAVTSGNKTIVARLAQKLQRLLLATVVTGWRFDEEEGLLDPAKLTQIITTGEPLAYRLPSEVRLRDTVVTLLVDNSGSMRGRPIEMAAISADLLARTLDRCGVGVEVLGFTTQTWKGGQSRLHWIAAGSPENPGRLNDLLHIVYKDADEPYRKAKSNFSVMLADDLLKENIDGESLLWAYRRLLARKENRKILLVISDGAPVDYATDKHNPLNYLDRHLRAAIHHIEKTDQVELLAIGIGHDVRRYYRNAITIDDPSQLGPAIVDRMVDLFGDPTERRDVARKQAETTK